MQKETDCRFEISIQKLYRITEKTLARENEKKCWPVLSLKHLILLDTKWELLFLRSCEMFRYNCNWSFYWAVFFFDMFNFFYVFMKFTICWNAFLRCNIGYFFSPSWCIHGIHEIKNLCLFWFSIEIHILLLTIW